MRWPTCRIQSRVLTIRTAADGDDFVLISVYDAGPGIAAGTLEKVFEPFFTSKANGLGLGYPSAAR